MKQKYDEAIKDYSVAIRLDPKNSFAFAQRGVARVEKQDYDRAIQDLTEAIRLDPKPYPYVSRAYAYYLKRN